MASRATERCTNIKGSPLGASLGACRVCVHVRDHGQLRDSTNWEAQSRRATEAQALAPTCQALLEEAHFLDSLSGGQSLSLIPSALGKLGAVTHEV